MDLVLVSITGISLLLAIAMGLVVFRLQRDERRRSEARVALLAAAAEDDSIYLYEREAAAVYADSEPAAAAAPLFASREAESPWLRRIAIAGAAAAAIALTVHALTFVASPSSSKAASQAAPLELVALQHAYDGSTLTITGTVQNPKAGLPVARIAVTATVLGDDGSTLATGRSALDYAALAPGEDSPFVIKIPVQGTVNRYRVGFRRPDGSILAHVDRRTGGSSARHTGDTGSAPWVR